MQFIQQAKEIWNRLPMTGRVATALAAIATLGLVGAIIYYGSQGDYGVLFSDLKPADAQTIVEKLKAENVPYTLTASGTTVSVPAERVSELRLQMAGTGILSGGHVGFDLFDKTSFGATDFAQQVNFRRAVEGELAKTLEGMDEIEQARVHITPKKESVFTEKEEGAKASVMVRVRQSKELTNERTEAIVSLVSSSVEGLDPSNVSVMDTRGRLLTSGRGKPGSFGDAGAFNAQLESKRKYETETAARIVSLIEPIAGEGRVRADVAADVDFSQIEQTEEKYNPQSQVVRSQQTAQETRTSSSVNPVSQAVGVRSNDPTAQTQNTTTQNTQSGNDQRTTNQTNYEIDKTVKRTVGGGGRVNRMTVSVLVDYKNVNETNVTRSPDELQKIQELVAAAVGTDEKRGDSIVVQTMPFDKPQIDEAGAASWFEKNNQLTSSLIKYAVLIFIALLLFLFVIRPARKALKAAMTPGSEPKLLPGSRAENGERRQDGIEDLAHLPPMTVAEIEAKIRGEKSLGAAPQNVEAVRTKLVEQAIAEPELVAGTLRGWLRE